ncbi:hypothetical protein G5C51_34070 [Streptomyces sp. A7024]|uniref:Uncharacterized protein n=1 Tax=Streptomyces coryli TaxID=1128680 RepID=A0A6G4UBZ6_9ACTN|nr:hypothetical protein [Streptomyces coryli]NGN68908.1 hypothetical protein [Streptomyces coryli]
MTTTETAPRAAGRYDWVAPVISTLLTLPAMVIAWFAATFSVMACDSCGSAEAEAFESSYDIAYPVFMIGLLVPLGLLITSYALPWEPRNQEKRVLFALLAPLSVVLLYLGFAGIVDWPS